MIDTHLNLFKRLEKYGVKSVVFSLLLLTWIQHHNDTLILLTCVHFKNLVSDRVSFIENSQPIMIISEHP